MAVIKFTKRTIHGGRARAVGERMSISADTTEYGGQNLIRLYCCSGPEAQATAEDPKSHFRCYVVDEEPSAELLADEQARTDATPRVDVYAPGHEA